VAALIVCCVCIPVLIAFNMRYRVWLSDGDLTNPLILDEPESAGESMASA